MPLTPNSIFHFTSKEKLKWTLENNFRVRYCLENISCYVSAINAAAVTSIAVPMVSFCDIPLSQIKDHYVNYGKYGIGFKKEWARNKGLNPVLYIDQFSKLNQQFTYFNSFNGIEDTELDKTLIELIRYMKNYEGLLQRAGESDKPNYRFANEKEWRYVPDFNSKFKPFIYGRNYDKISDNANLDKYPEATLHFEPNDISYIIIQNEDERAEFIEFLTTVKEKNYKDDVPRLNSRILTTELIDTDF